MVQRDSGRPIAVATSAARTGCEEPARRTQRIVVRL